ncbi:hypothetical protein KTD26_26640 [Burkholderia multivorans]|uniref:hypothetical protein n=1 Tax=Burkholderia cepacia complex TaxID=87882 RepID=UPI000A834A00|nr:MULTISPECIES: hypothetical protein [Burkholderia cepacia complex]MBU9146095.1 hypothetical protein [Burkholderia multivorans]HEF4774602.1 hypothetical protein [Burkholderia multivorans]
MNTIEKSALVSKIRNNRIVLPKIKLQMLSGEPSGTSQSGVAVTTYGQGQVTGGIYTVPAHGQINVDFKVRIQCVTPNDIQKMSDLIRSLLEASKQHLYDELQRTSISGGASFFGFFGWGGGSASYEDTKHTMDSFGLSEANQEKIVDAMMKIAQQSNEFNYSGTVFNKDYDYDVSGSLFGIVMDAVIQQGQYQNHVRFLAPNVHLQSADGSQLPLVDPLYSLNN